MAQTLYIAVKGDTKDLVNSLKKAENITVQSGKKMTGGLDGVSKAYKVLAGAAGAYISVQAGLNLIRVADNYSLLGSRLKLVTGSTEELARAEGELLKIANSTRITYESTADLYTKVSRATKELGISEERRMATTEALNKAFIVSGASQEAIRNSTLQLTQALQGGVVRAEEYNSIMENTPRVLEAVAAGMGKSGVSMGELRKIMLDGNLTSEAFFEAFERGSSGIAAEFDKMSVTVGQAGTVLQNVFYDILDSTNDASGGTDGLAEAILDLANTISENKEGIVSLFSAIVKGAELAAKGVGLLGKSLMGYKRLYEELKGEPSPFEKLNESLTKASAANGPAQQLRDKIADLREQMSLAEYAAGNFGQGQEEAKKHVESLRREIAAHIIALDNLIMNEGEAAKATVESAKERDDASKGASEKIKEYSEKELKAYEKSADGIIDAWEIMHNDRYEVQGRAIQNEVEAEQAKIAEIMRMEEEAKEAEKLLYEQKQETIDQYTEFAQERMSSFFSQLIDGDFKNAGEAWDALWKSMLKTVADTVAQMAAKFVVGKVVEAFFHEGAWNLKNDEYRAVLQDGEMVIPRDESSQIRAALGDESGTVYGFEGLLKAVKRGTGQGGPAGEGDPGEGPAAADRSGIPGYRSDFESVGRMFGSVMGKYGPAFAGVPSNFGLTGRVGSIVGAEVFGAMSDLVGDLFDARDFESIRDAVEDGTLTQHEARMSLSRAKASEIEGTPFDAISNMASSAWGSFADAAMSLLGDVTGGRHGTGGSSGSGFGLGQEGLGEGIGGDVGGARGSGDEGSSSPGGVGGYAKGGMVDKLLIPRGDDGLAGLKFGERVLSVQQNENLTRMLSGTGPNDLIALMKNLIAVVKNQNVSVNVHIGREKMNNLVDRVVVERNRRGIRPTERAYVAG